jgi:hypothetical protein
VPEFEEAAEGAEMMENTGDTGGVSASDVQMAQIRVQKAGTELKQRFKKSAR